MAHPASVPARSPDSGELTGTTVGRFAVGARLGAGGMGEVYRAEDTRLKRSVALKRIAPRRQVDPGYRDRFLREAQFASGLSDPHIAGVYDVFEDQERMFLVMEYVEGTSLRKRLPGPVEIEEFLSIAVQCAAALAAAHERGIVHRDIKPENIMLTPEGQVKVLDFGVAKKMPRLDDAATADSLGPSAALAGEFCGTLPYMAPEVLLERKTDHRADIFSLGVVCYEALVGRHPFRDSGFLATATRILQETPPPLGQGNPKVPAELERIVTKTLAKDPAERYATAADLLVDLRAVQREWSYPSAVSRLPGAVPAVIARKPSFVPKNKYVWWSAAAVAAILLLVGGIALWKGERLSWWFGPRVPPGSKNLVVMPFQAIGEEPQTQAYTDGITETLSAQLTRLTAAHQLQVAPAREVRGRRFRNAADARKEFGAGLVLEGSVFRSGSTVRVNYALVDTLTLKQLRADTITADASNPFAVQDRVAEGIVRMLELELKPQERAQLQAHGTQTAGAYDFYLQGRGYMQNYDKPENIENAISVLDRALRLDPNYALAYAGLGEAYWKKYEAKRDAKWVEPARQACRRALAINGQLAEAHACLGMVENGTGQYEIAVKEFQQVLQSEPTSDAAYRGLALAYEKLGKLAEAEQTYRQAIAARPHYWAGYSWLGGFYFNRARYAEAAEMFRQVVALAPDSFRGYYNLGGVYVQQGRYAEAIGTLEHSVAIRPSATALSNLATAYYFQRLYDDAARTYEQAVKLDERNYELWWDLGDAYYWSPGKRDQATAAYQKSIALADQKLAVNPQDIRPLGIRAFCYAVSQNRRLALADLSAALTLAPGDAQLLYMAALIHLQMGEKDQSLDWLEKAVAAGYSPAIVRDTPNFDVLRSHPRFQNIGKVK